MRRSFQLSLGVADGDVVLLDQDRCRGSRLSLASSKRPLRHRPHSRSRRARRHDPPVPASRRQRPRPPGRYTALPVPCMMGRLLLPTADRSAAGAERKGSDPGHSGASSPGSPRRRLRIGGIEARDPPERHGAMDQAGVAQPIHRDLGGEARLSPDLLGTVQPGSLPSDRRTTLDQWIGRCHPAAIAPEPIPARS